MVGTGYTTISCVAVPEQPFPFVPVKVYVVVALGFAETVMHVLQLKLDEGLQT